MATTEVMGNAEAVEAIRTVAPQAVEALRLSNERYLVQVPKLVALAQKVKEARAPILAEAKADQKTLAGLRKQAKALKTEDAADTYKTLWIQMSEVGARIKAVRGRADKDATVISLTNDQEAVAARIAEIDQKMPEFLRNALVQALIA